MDKILAFIKKYTSLLIPAGIVLIALIFIVVTTIVGGTIKEKMSKSVKLGKSVDRAVGSTHSLKDVDDEKFYQDKLESDSKRVRQLARQTTLRELISYDIFPEPSDPSVQIFSSFGMKYRGAIDALLKGANARSAPTGNEIDLELARRGSGDRTPATARGRRPRGRVKVDARKLTEDAFLKKRASEMALYATAKVFDWYTFWEEYDFVNEETAVEHCWYSQLAFWVYKDVVESVASMNSISSTVFNSDVKRLVGVNFSRDADYLKDVRTTVGSARRGGVRKKRNASQDMPEYVVIDEDMRASVGGNSLGFQINWPFTDRGCDDNIDVIHFSVAVVITADAVFPFIKELCSQKEHVYTGYLKDIKPSTFKRNQITVLKYQQEPVNLIDDDHERFRYGDKAVVKLSLTCEYVFNRSGYDVIKPTSVVKHIEDIRGISKDNDGGAGKGY
jgi:hypothetical protein